jgi:hypothetical protein
MWWAKFCAWRWLRLQNAADRWERRCYAACEKARIPIARLHSNRGEQR